MKLFNMQRICAFGLLAVVFAASNRVHAADGYAAIGHLTHTRFDALGKPVFKDLIMFEVKVDGARWHVRTEPVRESGVGYDEVGYGTNDEVVKVSAFDTAYSSSKSPFANLRKELKETRKEDLSLTNSRVNIEEIYSKKFPTLVVSKKENANHVYNDAVANVRKGKFPGVDSSYAALLWFAFNPPIEQKVGTNRMLLQIWDDGSPNKTRFRQASWKQFEQAPHLVSGAQYEWIGKELLPDGRFEAIKIVDASKPLSTAVRYEVGGTTNLGSIVLPLGFTLTRFNSKRVGNEEPKVVTTVEASVVSVRQLSAEESLEVEVPGNTIFTDLRGSITERVKKP